MTSLRLLRVAGVPEHFNHPWHQGRADGRFARAGIDLQFLTVDGGTGAMINAVIAGTADVAVALTEGIMAGIVKNQAAHPLRYCGEYVTSPLRWMIATGATRDFSSLEDLRQRAVAGGNIRISISRLG